MAIILIPHQPIDFTYRENEPCENLSDMCLQYETGDNPMFQIKRSSNSVPLVTITGIWDSEFEEVAIPVLSQGNNYFTYQLNFAELGITEGCFEICVYEATGATLVTNGSFASDLSEWTVVDGLLLSISSFTNPSDDETCDGEVELSASGGTGPFTYSIDGINYQPSTTFTALCYGQEYTFWVKDSKGVTKSIVFQFQDCSQFANSEAFDIKDIYAFEISNCEAFDFV